MTFRPVIGLEVHVELSTKSKMFCGCPANHFGVEPNTHTCPVCLGLPGALPVANAEGIRRTIKIGLALACEVAKESKFDRKNYFYPDLAKGYQISQYDQPLCFDGHLWTRQGEVGIERVHLEEDTAKLQHVHLTVEEQQQAEVAHSDVSLVDFNRCGVGLVEIVTKPDLTSAVQAKEYAKNLVQILRALDVSDCDMEKGSLRLEANISVQSEEEAAAEQLPAYKVEVKNLNSFRFLERAIAYEIARHTELRVRGDLPKQETRGWDDAKGETYSQRSKENAEDYRYFPDPDLPPMQFDEAFVSEVRAELPELPRAKAQRWQSEFGLSEANALQLVAEYSASPALESLFTMARTESVEPQQVANAIVNKKVVTWLTEGDEFASAPEAQAAEQKRVLRAVLALHTKSTIDPEVLHAIVKKVIAENEDAAEKYRSGKIQVIGFLIGQVMRQLPEKGDTKQVQEALQEQLGKK